MTIAFARMFGQFFVFYPAQFMRCKVHAKWEKCGRKMLGVAEVTGKQLRLNWQQTAPAKRPS